jgi:hypothetical protein
MNSLSIKYCRNQGDIKMNKEDKVLKKELKDIKQKILKSEKSRLKEAKTYSQDEVDERIKETLETQRS